jgi:DNA-binding CsgD family transcriptional regulator
MEARDQKTPLYGIDALQAVSNWLLDMHELSTVIEFDTFPKKALVDLGKFIPHQASFWGGGRITEDIPVLHYLYINDIDPATLVAWEAHKNEVSATTKLLAENAGRAYVFSAAESPGDPLFAKIFGTDGISDILTVFLFDDQRGLYHAISLYRRNGVAFSETERGIFQAVAPHLIRGLRNCHIAHINRLSKSPLINLATKAIVDKEGFLHFAEDRLITSLRTEWPDWRGPMLPLEAWGMLSRGDAARRKFVGKRIVLSLEGNATLLLLLARPKLAVDDLSIREREVAVLFASGLKYKEIAQHLNVSPSTIRCQLNSVYTKLNINDKGALAEYLKQL